MQAPLWAPADKAMVFVTPLDILDMSRCLFWQALTHVPPLLSVYFEYSAVHSFCGTGSGSAAKPISSLRAQPACRARGRPVVCRGGSSASISRGGCLGRPSASRLLQCFRSKPRSRGRVLAQYWCAEVYSPLSRWKYIVCRAIFPGPVKRFQQICPALAKIPVESF